MSALFAVPSLDLKPNLAIYWAVVCPLTLLIILACVLWTFMQQRRHGRKNKAAQEEISDRSSVTEVKALVVRRTRRGSGFDVV